MELEFEYNFELITKEEIEASMGDYNSELPHEYRNFYWDITVANLWQEDLKHRMVSKALL